MLESEIIDELVKATSVQVNSSSSQESNEDISNLCSKLSVESISTLLLRSQTLSQLKSLFSAVIKYCTSSEGKFVALTAVKVVIEMLCTNAYTATSSEMSELVQYVSLEIDDFSGNDIVLLMNVFMDKFDFEGKKASKETEEQMKQVLDILSKLINMCNNPNEMVDHELEGGGVSFTEYRNRYIQRLTERNWYDQYICSILIVLKECKISGDVLITVVNKINKSLSRLNDVLVSSIVYQVLLLITTNDTRVVMISILLNIYKKCNKKQFPLIITHIVYAFRNHSALCKVFLEIIKSEIIEMNCFLLLLLLSLSQIEKYKNGIYSILIDLIEEEWKMMDYRHSYQLIEEDIRAESDLRHQLHGIIEIVNDGYIEGSAIILDFYHYLLHYKTKGNTLLSYWISSFAGSAILNLFTTVPSSRSAIINTIIMELNRHDINTEYIVLLNSICHKYPSFMVQNINFIRMMISHIPTLNSTVVSSLLQSIHTIISNRSDIIDTLVIILKKCCYQSDETIRMCGITGFCELLCKSQHQNSNDSNSGSPEVVSLTQVGLRSIDVKPSLITLTTIEDIMNLYRRYASSLHSSKLDHSYAFFSILFKCYNENAAVRPFIHQILLDRMSVASPTSTQPSSSHIRIGDSCRNGVMMNPLHLVMSVVCLILFPSDGCRRVEQNRWTTALQEEFGRMAKDVVESDIEDYGFDKGCNFNSNDTEGRTNLLKRMMMISVYINVLYVKTVRILALQDENIEERDEKKVLLSHVMIILNSIQRLNKLAGEKGKDPYSKDLCNLLTLKPCLLNLLSILITYKNEKKDLEIVKLVDSIMNNDDTMAFLINCVDASICDYELSGLKSGENYKQSQYICSICKACYKLHLTFYFQESKNNTIICPLLLSVLYHSIQFVLSSSFLFVFYRYILNTENRDMSIHEDSEVEMGLEDIQKMKETIVEHLFLTNNGVVMEEMLITIHNVISVNNIKISDAYIKLLSIWGENVNKESVAIQQLQEWLVTALHDQSLVSRITDSLFSLLCRIITRREHPFEVLHSYANAVLSVLGAIQVKNLTVEQPHQNEELQFITPTNGNSFTITMISTFSVLLSVLTHTLAKAKYYNVKNTLEQERICFIIHNYYDTWKKEAISVVTAAIVLVHSILPLTCTMLSIAAGEALIGFLRSLYEVLDQIGKTLAVSSADAPIQLITALSELVCTKLTPNIYVLIHILHKPDDRDAHIKKQAKLIPDLIYCIEQYETTLINITKRTKGEINVGCFVKRSVARDFRIDTSKMMKRVEERGEEEHESKKKKK